MTYGYNPELSSWSPFHGGVYAMIEAIAKITAMGGDYKKIRLSLQEYFERLDKSPEKWGKPFTALLGAYYIQTKLGLPAIGGKDSMSGTFNDINVPPTLVAFAVSMAEADKIISSEFKETDSEIVFIPLKQDEYMLPDLEELDKNYNIIYKLIQDKKILAASTVKQGGLSEAISKMSFGNKIGFRFKEEINNIDLFSPQYGSIIIEIPSNEEAEKLFKGIDYIILGKTHNEEVISLNKTKISLQEAIRRWEEPLENVFLKKPLIKLNTKIEEYKYTSQKSIKSLPSIGKPKVFIPVFPDTNTEYDIIKAFEKSGGIVDTLIFKNLNPSDIRQSVEEMAKMIDRSQILVLPGGFSGGEGPEGSGLYAVAAFRNPILIEATMNLLNKRQGLILGVGSGFQALLKLGLLPYGKIINSEDTLPVLTYNITGRHVSTMVRTKIVSNLSPWFTNAKVGDVFTLPISHGKGRFIASQDVIKEMDTNGQIATQYVDFQNKPTYDINFNPNGSINAIESITNTDGRILGTMTHPERMGDEIIKNIPTHKQNKIFEAGIKYFK